MRTAMKALAVLALLALLLPGCTKETDPTPPEVATYAGSDACQTCHSTQHEYWADSGHPYKLTKLDGEAPTGSFPEHAAYPNDAIDPPTGAWADYAYTVGGYGWKMRWIGPDGYLFTPEGGGNQYNFEDQSWADYNAGEVKPYDCGSCHATGWIADEDADTDGDLTDNQDGLEGMHGTFAYSGIHCEECHGLGSLHVAAPNDNAMTTDASSEFCGRCHTRGGVNGVSPGADVIEAKGGFIKHHEQYDEWYYSDHNSTYGPTCNGCHDPHASTKWDAAAAGDGVNTTCESCHVEGDYADILYTAHGGSAGCLDCHMPKASKSAIKLHDHAGDIASHTWAINTDAVGKDAMYNSEGSSVLTDGEGGPALTLDFACYGCHVDDQGVGGTASAKTLEELSAFAEGMHTAP